jgi:hypothetical protein
MVQGGCHLMMERGQTKEHLGSGPIINPTGQPFEPKTLVELVRFLHSAQMVCLLQYAIEE